MATMTKQLIGGDEVLSPEAEDILIQIGTELFELIAQNSITEAKARQSEQGHVTVEQCDAALVCEALFKNNHQKTNKSQNPDHLKRMELLEKYRESKENNC